MGIDASLAQLAPVGRLHLHLAHAAVFDPTNSGRVTMDYLMKLVTTALEWTYAAGETDVKAETLEKAASLLVLRRDTLRIIDGAGPSLDASPSESTEQEQASGTEAEQVSSPHAQPEQPPSNRISVFACITIALLCCR